MTCRAEVLGFTEKDRHDFIHTALQDQNGKIKNLNDYLLENQQLNLLCYVPLNMSLLLCLAQKGIDTLPKSQTVLYKNFILMTITHFLNKDKKKLELTLTTNSVKSFADLPHLYDEVFKELSQFAFLALQKDQLVFSLSEVKAEYPYLNPANWYGLGLLKSAQYFEAQDGCDHQSFHFLHYSIQEYMVANYIASLPNNELLQLLNETFWNVRYFNTWLMYVGITGGKHFIFIHFLSGNYLQMSSWLSTPKLISKNILTNKIKCLQLLRCSTEAECEILLPVKNIFAEQIIDLSNTSLSNNDLHTLAMLLIRSPAKEWEMLNLSQCNINDSGCMVLCDVFHSQKISLKIKKVDISYNKIHWESLSSLCEIFKLWQTEELLICIDALYDSTTMNIVNNFTNLLYRNVKTYITGQLHSTIILCTYMAEQQRMFVVGSQQNHFIGCYQLTNCILNDKTIKELKDLIAKNIHILVVKHIAFSYNISYSEATIKSTILSHHVQKLTLHGSNMYSKGAYLMSIPATIQCNDKPYQVVADYLAAVLCHNIQTSSSYLKTVPASLAIKIINNFQKTSNIKSFVFDNMNIGKEAANDIAAVLVHNTNLQKLHLNKNNLESTGTNIILWALQ